MPATPPKQGDTIRCEFTDHVEDGKDVLACVVYGLVLSVTRDCLTVESWTCLGVDQCTTDANSKRFCICRRAIDCVTVLRRAGE